MQVEPALEFGGGCDVAKGQCVKVLYSHRVNYLFEPVKWECFRVIPERELGFEIFKVKASRVQGGDGEEARPLCLAR